MSKGRPRGGRIFSRPSGLSLDPPSVPSKKKERSEPIHTAYCPLFEGLCSNVECENCSYLWEAFPSGVLACTVCVHKVEITPFYADGFCEFCGHSSGFLTVGVPDE